MIIPLQDWQYKMYNALDREKAEESYMHIQQQKTLVDSLEESLYAELIIKVLSDIVENSYGLGKVKETFKMYGGQINISYGVVVEQKDGTERQYFIRKYNRFADENRVMFEHDFLKFLLDNGLDIIPGVVKTLDGKTFVKSEELGKEYIFAVYEFLEGEDRYRWFEDTTPPDVCNKIGIAVANFHNTSSHYDTSRFASDEPGVYDMMDEFKTRFQEFKDQNLKSIYNQTFCNNFDEIMSAIDKIENGISKEEVESLPKVTVNGDLHQGNMKYDKDGNVVGLFDFDWVKTDSRLFEIAGMLLYLISSWQDNDDGEMDMEKLRATMKGYQGTLRDLNDFAPLSETEAKALPYFIQMCCIYNLVNWSACDHYQVFDSINVYEYDYYLRHGLRARRYAEEHADEITKAVMEC